MFCGEMDSQIALSGAPVEAWRTATFKRTDMDLPDAMDLLVMPLDMLCRDITSWFSTLLVLEV
jgi:hypothetical protein